MAMNDSKPRHPASWVPTLYTAEGLPFVVRKRCLCRCIKAWGRLIHRSPFLQILWLFPGR